MDPYENPKLSPEARAADLVSRMTTEEKISQMGSDAPPLKRLLTIPSRPGGPGSAGTVAFPQDIAKAATWDPDLASGGGNINLARDPRWGRTAGAFGEDPYLTAQMTMNAYQLQHFALNNEEHRRHSGSANLRDQRVLREYYLAPFRIGVKKGQVQRIMSAYNALNGVPCTCNKFLLTYILRDEWGFDGYVISDAGSIKEIWSDHHYTPTEEEAAAMALKAGCDYALMEDTYQKNLPKALEDGLISEEDIDRAIRRIFTVRFRQGEFDPVEEEPTKESPEAIYKALREKALKIARESIVLLKNEGDLLPLNKEKIDKILVSGPGADFVKLGDYRPTPSIKVSPLQGIKNEVAGTGIEVFYENKLDEAVKVAKESDVAIFFTRIYEGEGHDRFELKLPDNQPELIRAIAKEVPTVVVLIGGSTITMQDWIDYVPAILDAWIPGGEGGTAIADVLFGKYNPGGKLPLTFYKSIDQLPAFDEYNIREANSTYLYLKEEPQFPFGHGLSYTKFKYSNLNILPKRSYGETINVTVEVENIGDRKGDEVVQLYIHDKERSTGDQPIKELKGFKRITLEPKEKKEVIFSLKPSEDLAFYDKSLNYLVEPGEFEVMVGASSEDIRLKGSFEVAKLIKVRGGPEISYDKLKISKTKIKSNEPFTVSVRVKNTGELTGTPEVKLYVDGEPVDSQMVVVPIEGSCTVNFTKMLCKPGLHKVSIASLPPKTVTIEPRPATFIYSDLKVPPLIKKGENVEITVNIKNIGSYEATAHVDLKLNGEIVKSKAVTIPSGPGGVTKKVTFSYNFAKTGSFKISVGDLTQQVIVY